MLQPLECVVCAAVLSAVQNQKPLLERAVGRGFRVSNRRTANHLRAREEFLAARALGRPGLERGAPVPFVFRTRRSGGPVGAGVGGGRGLDPDAQQRQVGQHSGLGLVRAIIEYLAPARPGLCPGSSFSHAGLLGWPVFRTSPEAPDRFPAPCQKGPADFSHLAKRGSCESRTAKTTSVVAREKAKGLEMAPWSERYDEARDVIFRAGGDIDISRVEWHAQCTGAKFKPRIRCLKCGFHVTSTAISNIQQGRGVGCPNCVAILNPWHNRYSEAQALVRAAGGVLDMSQDEWRSECTGVDFKPRIRCSKCQFLVTSTHINSMRQGQGLGCLCRNKTEGRLFAWTRARIPDACNNELKCKNKETGGTMSFDISSEAELVVIELDGDIEGGHFDPLGSTAQRDLLKEEWALANGYALIRVLQMDVWLDKNGWENFLLDKLAKWRCMRARGDRSRVFTPDAPEYLGGIYAELRNPNRQNDTVGAPELDASKMPPRKSGDETAPSAPEEQSGDEAAESPPKPRRRRVRKKNAPAKAEPEPDKGHQARVVRKALPTPNRHGLVWDAYQRSRAVYALAMQRGYEDMCGEDNCCLYFKTVWSAPKPDEVTPCGECPPCELWTQCGAEYDHSHDSGAGVGV